LNKYDISIDINKKIHSRTTFRRAGEELNVSYSITEVRRTFSREGLNILGLVPAPGTFTNLYQNA